MYICMYIRTHTIFAISVAHAGRYRQGCSLACASTKQGFSSILVDKLLCMVQLEPQYHDNVLQGITNRTKNRALEMNSSDKGLESRF